MMTNKKKSNVDPEEYVKALSHDAAINILLKLCKENAFVERIATMARASLANVSADEIADEVFRSLNSIDIEDLWDNSGETRWGYQDPTEVAYEMIDDRLCCFIQKMKQCNSLSMKQEEMEYCKGVIAGLLKYGTEGDNEFHDSVPDDPYTHAENILYDWKNSNTDENIKEVQAVYDRFFSDSE